MTRTVETHKRPYAVFDVDGTIFRSSLLIEVVEDLIQAKIFPPEAQQLFEDAHKRWLDREGDYSTYISKVVDAFMLHIKGVHYGDFMDVARKTVASNQKRTYRYTRDLLAQLKDDGYFLLAISHSPKAILDLFCPALGFDKVYGMFYSIGPQDRFTGEIEEKSLILNKAAILKRAVERESLSQDDSIGVGDTESDISFLDIVERPICFNPNSKLYQVAKVRGWDIVVERKDVIYEL
jgi:HAD superfamily phosphoserine phosphatase-like hydrolase